jgi:hypothetical protein
MSLAFAIASMVAAALQGMSWIPSAVKTGITTVTGLLSLITKYTTNPPQNVTGIVLAVLQATISTLELLPNLSDDQKAEIAELRSALAGAVAANAVAVQGVDPSKLGPITPLP